MVPDGLGTALKPAWEPIVVARKPLAGTVAANVLAHGTGALNVDATRIGTSKDTPASASGGERPLYGDGWAGQPDDASGMNGNVGRWPANVVLDPEAAAMLDKQTGKLHSPKPYTPNVDKSDVSMFGIGYVSHDREFGDSGGASRFFYCAKASSAERNAGLDGFEAVEKRTVMNDGLQGPRPHTAPDYEWKPRDVRNVHPTVKPIDLMRWLVRLVTPPGGLVLDPFAGSGTTGCAAVLEGFRFVGIEREPEYAAIARARIAWWSEHPDGMELVRRLEHERERKAQAERGQHTLF